MDIAMLFQLFGALVVIAILARIGVYIGGIGGLKEILPSKGD